jgi:hypothetical protein
MRLFGWDHRLNNLAQLAMSARSTWRDLLDQRVAFGLRAALFSVAAIKQLAEVVSVKAFLAGGVETNADSPVAVVGDGKVARAGASDDGLDELAPIHAFLQIEEIVA